MGILIGLGIVCGTMLIPIIILGIQAIIVNILDYRLEVYRIAAEMETKNEKTI